jgi:hypothetical protein
MTQQEQLQQLADLITKEQQEDLIASGLGCEANLQSAIAYIKAGRKYTKIDVGSSGKYMVENSTGRIYGIKAYGQVHLGHYYGTLDTIDQYHWGRYYAAKKA